MNQSTKHSNQSTEDIEPFRVRLTKTIYNPDFHQECQKWINYYFAFAFLIIILINVFIAYKFKNADLLVLCILWFLLAWRYFKKGREVDKIMKEV